MSPSQARRHVATVDGFSRLAPPSDETARAIAETRAAYALARAQRFVERRVADRRQAERRQDDRRIAHTRTLMLPTLAIAAMKCRDMRFDNGAVHSAFARFV